MSKNNLLAKLSFVLCLGFLLSSCDPIQNFFKGVKTYEHPSLYFTIEYPANWILHEGGSFGTQVQFLSSESEIFLANANIIATKASSQDLDQLADDAVKQLSIILSGYEVLTKSYGQLGPLRSVDIRARYEGKEGPRIIRSIIALDQGMEYVFTFSCQADREKFYQKTIHKMIASFSLSHKI